VETIFAAHGLRIFDVEELPTHGGSLRIMACRSTSSAHETGAGVAKVRADERAAGFDRIETYAAFQSRVVPVKTGLLAFLEQAAREGKSVAAYGAAAKGNTLLNFSGVNTDQIDYVVDRNPVKQGHYLPGSHLPVLPPERIMETRPDYLLILPWNIRDEVMASMAGIRQWGGRFVVAVPELTVLP
jgi:hypothetical protein